MRYRHFLMLLVAFVVAALFTLSAGPARADGFIVVEPNPQITVPHRHYQFAPLQVEYHHVTVTIKGQVAVTEIDQVFYNPNNARLEGTYLFPLPEGAHIRKFSMDVNGKQQEAELLDAQKAREIYTRIVSSMKDPALLEYVGRGLYKCRIFPIEPKGKKHIKLSYTELLDRDSDLTGYTYPLNTEKFSSAPIKSVRVKVNLQTERPLRNIYSPSHNIDVVRKDAKNAVISYESSDSKPDTDFQLFYGVAPPEAGDIGVNLLTYRDPSDNESYFMMLLSPGVDVSEADIVRKDVTFVLDTSGSMAGDKLEQAKRALNFCIHNLNENDRFQIIRFSTEAEGVFDSLVKADKAHIDRAGKAVQAFKAQGGTAIEDALVLAAQAGAARSGDDAQRPHVVIFLTDGRPTIGETDEDRILQKLSKATGASDVRVFCFGIGTDINTHLLDKVTRETKAVSQYVLPKEDIEIKVSNFYSKISHPVLNGISLNFGQGVKVSSVYPNPLPDIFKGDQLVLMGRIEGKGDTAITLNGNVNGQKRKLTYETTIDHDSTHDFIPRLWATRRVGYLLEQIRLNGETTELKDEVTRLARAHGIVTPYTAYLIVEDEAKRPNLREDDRIVRPMGAPARRELRKGKEDLEAKSGDTGVGNAEAVTALKQASTPADSKRANVLADRGAGGAIGKDGKLEGVDGDGRTALEQRIGWQHRNVRGRTFYNNGKTWIDATLREMKKQPEPIEITFASDAYFALLKKHPEAAAWLSLGTNVKLVLDGKVYEIVEAEQDKKDVEKDA